MHVQWRHTAGYKPLATYINMQMPVRKMRVVITGSLVAVVQVQILLLRQAIPFQVTNTSKKDMSVSLASQVSAMSMIVVRIHHLTEKA